MAYADYNDVMALTEQMVSEMVKEITGGKTRRSKNKKLEASNRSEKKQRKKSKKGDERERKI